MPADPTHDALTGLLSRFGLEDHLERVSQSRSEDSVLLIACIDLDNFKRVNEGGVLTGDAYLRELGALLAKETVAEGGVVARVGGDEFVVVLQPESIEQGLVAMRGLLLSIAGYRLLRRTQAYACAASAGVVFASTGSDIRQLLPMADIACFEAKQAGGNQALLYQPYMAEKYGEHMIPTRERDRSR